MGRRYNFYRVGKKYPLLNGKGILTYLKYTFTYCCALYNFFRLKKPDLLIASDFKVIIPALIYAKTRKVRLIYNIHDNLAHRYNIPPILASILNLLEGLGVFLSDSAIVPEGFRKDLLPFGVEKKFVLLKIRLGILNIQNLKFLMIKLYCFMVVG